MPDIPRLCRPAPLVSSITVTSSFNIVNWIWNSAPVSSNQERWYDAFSRSTTAFFTMDWQSERCAAGNPATTPDREPVLWPIQRSHGRALTPGTVLQSCAPGMPISTCTRSAVRQRRLAGPSFPVPGKIDPPGLGGSLPRRPFAAAHPAGFPPRQTGRGRNIVSFPYSLVPLFMENQPRRNAAADLAFLCR